MAVVRMKLPSLTGDDVHEMACFPQSSIFSIFLPDGIVPNAA